MKKFPLFLGWLLVVARVPAVILLDTDDPNVNTSAPGDALTGSGWQYEGDWGGFLGTPISPNFFISAAHIGGAAGGFVFQGTTYSVIGSYWLPGSDLVIWKVAGPLPAFAPLYSNSNESGRHLVVIGKGTRRGPPRVLNGTLRGWDWGADDGARRWGENDVTAIVPYSGHDLLRATFDQHLIATDHPNEAHLSRGDSGGAVFIQDGMIWKLAGINFAVDGPLWETPPPPNEPREKTQLFAALFDATGYYYFDDTTGSYVQLGGPAPVPTAFYASRISSELAWIGSVIADPQPKWEDHRLTVTYWRLSVDPGQMVYQVQTTSDLLTWQDATVQEEIVATAGDMQQIKATIDPGTGDHLCARVRVTRPSSP